MKSFANKILESLKLSESRLESLGFPGKTLLPGDEVEIRVGTRKKYNIKSGKFLGVHVYPEGVNILVEGSEDMMLDSPVTLRYSPEDQAFYLKVS